MFFIKKYIKGLVHEIVKEDIDSLITEALKGPNIKLKVKQYATQTAIEKKDIWNILLTQNLTELKLSIRYFDENDFERKFEVKGEDLKDLKRFIQKPDELIPDDARFIKAINLYVYFDYKGSSELESHNFMGYKSDRYDNKVVKIICKEVDDWLSKYPEYLL